LSHLSCEPIGWPDEKTFLMKSSSDEAKRQRLTAFHLTASTIPFLKSTAKLRPVFATFWEFRMRTSELRPPFGRNFFPLHVLSGLFSIAISF